MVDVGAEHRPELLVAALVDQVQVGLAERGQEAVGVVDLVRRRRRRRPRAGSPGRRRLATGAEHARPRCRRTRARAGSRCRRATTTTEDGQRLEDPDGHAAVVGVGAEDRVRVPVPPLDSRSSSSPVDGLQRRSCRVPLGQARDGRHRDGDPLGSVAGFVDDLVDRLVGHVRREQGLLRRRSARGRRRRRGRRRSCASTHSAARNSRCAPAPRCRRTAAAPHVGGVVEGAQHAGDVAPGGSRAAPARPAAWRARPRSRRSSSP